MTLDWLAVSQKALSESLKDLAQDKKELITLELDEQLDKDSNSICQWLAKALEGMDEKQKRAQDIVDKLEVRLINLMYSRD